MRLAVNGGTSSVYFGIIYVLFIPSRLPVFAEPLYWHRYFFFFYKYHLKDTYKKFHAGKHQPWVWTYRINGLLSKCWEMIGNANVHFMSSKINLKRHAQTMRYIIPNFINSSPLDKWPPLRRRQFKGNFQEWKVFLFRLKYHWNLFAWAQITIRQHWFREWLGTC